MDFLMNLLIDSRQRRRRVMCVDMKKSTFLRYKYSAGLTGFGASVLVSELRRSGRSETALAGTILIAQEGRCFHVFLETQHFGLGLKTQPKIANLSWLDLSRRFVNLQEENSSLFCKNNGCDTLTRWFEKTISGSRCFFAVACRQVLGAGPCGRSFP